MYNIRNWRGIFIDSLIKNKDFKSYLELGISVGECWREISLDNKTGIDTWVQINDGRIIGTTTDEYFELIKGTTKFDLIFIDADHEKNQVFKDFTNSFECLNDGGIILMHDINPPIEEDVNLSALGTCFEFWMELVENYRENCLALVEFPLEREGSMGVFFKDEKGFNPSKIGELNKGYQYFDQNRDIYINSIKVTKEDLFERIKTQSI
jgi:hypothetical protein